MWLLLEILEVYQNFEVLNPELVIATLAKDVTLKLLSILKKEEDMFLLIRINQTMLLSGLLLLTLSSRRSRKYSRLKIIV
jgi:hypothetical protein